MSQVPTLRQRQGHHSGVGPVLPRVSSHLKAVAAGNTRRSPGNRCRVNADEAVRLGVVLCGVAAGQLRL